MANTDKVSTLTSQLSGQEGQKLPEESQSGRSEEAETLKSAGDAAKNGGVAEVEKHVAVAPGESKPSQNPARPLLVQLGSNSATGPSAAPHPKRFSAVNINKKFLEKNSSASGSSPISQGSPASKAGGPSPRPQVQPSPSHSRLVTTKLTSTSPASSTSGAGWSRPSSVAPPNAAGSHSPNESSPLIPAASLATPSTTAGGPQLPHAGKVIQPQPRIAPLQPGLSSRDNMGGSAKPVWGNLKSTSASKRLDVRNDFPTAAEVAQVATSLRMAKLNDSREAAEAAAANKQARMEEADTFRGVHLDPNAHHWDEMEEDDDNFLDGVIEFGDGRQYKIESADLPSESSLLSDPASSPAGPNTAKSRLDGIKAVKDPVPNIPVSKEERFADDFDRSWPRSHTSPASSRDFPLPNGPPSNQALPSPVSPIIQQGFNSTQEASRVLFNERSNRLERYSSTQRPGPGQHRGGPQDLTTSPIESRSARDIPGASPSHNNIQLLQKPGNEPPSRFRRFSGGGGSSGGFGPGPSNTLSRRDAPPPSPRLPRDDYSQPGRDRDFNTERGRRSDMGPPPLPAHTTRGQSRDGGRQVPPHLSQISPIVPAQRLPSRDSRRQPYTQSGEPNVPNSARLPSQSPALSHTSAARISPAVAITPLPPLSAPELDEVQKDLMQSAAARAKQRRQQEEEEREKEKERARRKAAELEERIRASAEKSKALEEPEVAKLTGNQEAEAIALIEEAVKSVQLSKDSLDVANASNARPNLRRPPSLKGLPTHPVSDQARSLASRRPSTSIPGAVTPFSSAATPAVQVESWRSKAAPLPLPTAQRQVHPRPIPAFVTPPPSALEHVESLVDNSEEDLEVVDFSDMGKFVGVPDVLHPALTGKKSQANTPSRAVASDFFDEPLHVESVSARASDPIRHSQASSSDPVPVEQDNVSTRVYSPSDLTTDASFTSEASATMKETSTSDHHAQTIIAPPLQAGSLRTPRSQAFYKEAAMSALDDAMSRIKGALDGMQAVESIKIPLHSSDSENLRVTLPPATGKPISPKERWIPPALRPRTVEDSHEVFDVSRLEPPRSPKPAWNAFVVRLPTASQVLEPVNRKQLHLSARLVPQVRWDILSFDPPVEGMSRRDFSLNDILFRKQFGSYRGKPKYRVMLPRFRPGPRVNLPAYPLLPKVNPVGAFGRPTGADGVSTWRKAAQVKSESDDVNESSLRTISRSPPPDTLVLASLTISSSDEGLPTSSKADGHPVTPRSSRLQPKMPAGSAVAFYRDSRIDVVEEDPKPSVNFIVTSELESRQGSQAVTPIRSQSNIIVTLSPATQTSGSDSINATTSLTNGTKASSSEHLPTLVPSKADSKNSDNLTDRVPITPPTHHSNAPWARSSLNIPLKESPARGPDPEHLRAVWSQTSNKAGLHGINSLEGIADDLTALPFTIQDVKSEDGETPPPTVTAAPSRMSLYDVTKAFQTVPQAPSSSSSTPHRTPPIAAPPVTRPNYSYGLPPPASNNMRPGYPYPSPMMNHSPSPNLMYPHPLTASPVPSRMPVNGHTPLYSQPMWMAQNHGNMMRPMTSPYPGQPMPYPSPGTPVMYSQPPANMQNMTQQPGGGQANRDRNLPMMSPVMPHAGPAMYGSPVLMHAPIMQAPQNHGYTLRGQARTENGQIPMQQQQHHHSNYNPIAPSPYVRSTW